MPEPVPSILAGRQTYVFQVEPHSIHIPVQATSATQALALAQKIDATLKHRNVIAIYDGKVVPQRDDWKLTGESSGTPVADRDARKLEGPGHPTIPVAATKKVPDREERSNDWNKQSGARLAPSREGRKADCNK